MDKRNDCRGVFLCRGCEGNLICWGVNNHTTSYYPVMQGDGHVFKLEEWVGEMITWPFETMSLAPRERTSTWTFALSYVCIFGFKGASTSQAIGARNEMMMDDYDGQMIFRDLVDLNLPDIRLTGEEKPRKILTQETCPDRGSNPGPLRDKRACYQLFYLLSRELPVHNLWTNYWEFLWVNSWK